MLSIRQLDVYIDSLERQLVRVNERIAKDIPYNYNFAKWRDSGIVKPVANLKIPKSMEAAIPDSAWQNIIDMATGKIGNAKSNFDISSMELNDKVRSLRQYKLAWQQKFSLSFACFVLFLIGAPLGSIIRKGGIGTPLVFAVIFFVIFHLLNTTGEKMTKEGVLGTVVGPWLPCIALIPVGIFLTYKAMRDSQLFNKEYYLRTFKAIRKLVARRKAENSVKEM